jgi:hypothetical protein
MGAHRHCFLFDTARIWTRQVQLAVLSGHGGGVWSAAWSRDGRRIVTTSEDQTARIWDANVVADLDAQVAWSQAAKIDDLSDLERSRLGLLPDARIRTWSDDASGCDTAAAALYDPDRLAPGVAQFSFSVAGLRAEIASPGCAATSTGRALIAGRSGARDVSELARVGAIVPRKSIWQSAWRCFSGLSDHVRAVSL